jgi:Kef-type K+ transport system membrane component KefB
VSKPFCIAAAIFNYSEITENQIVIRFLLVYQDCFGDNRNMATHTIFLNIVIILLTARLFGEIASRINIPPVVGELVAGIVLGPSLLGFIEPDQVLHLLAEIGIILLLFEVGLDTDVNRLVQAGSKAVIVAFSGFFLPFLLGYLVSFYVFQQPTLVSLFIGGTLTATSIGITVRVLGDLKRKSSPEAQIVLGAAVIDDVLGVVLLSLLYEFSTGGGINLINTSKVFLFIGIFFLIAPVLAKSISLLIKRFENISEIPGMIPVTMVSLVLFFAWLAYSIGAPELMGGFAAGLAISNDPKFASRIEVQMQPIIQLFTPIFFVMVGLSLDLSAIDWTVSFIWFFFLSLLLIAIVSKLSGALLLRLPVVDRFAIGIAMIPRGEVGLIFAELGRAAGIFDNNVYAGIVMVIATTTIFPPIFLKWYYRHFGSRMKAATASSIDN